MEKAYPTKPEKNPETFGCLWPPVLWAPPRLSPDPWEEHVVFLQLPTAGGDSPGPGGVHCHVALCTRMFMFPMGQRDPSGIVTQTAGGLLKRRCPFNYKGAMSNVSPPEAGLKELTSSLM